MKNNKLILMLAMYEVRLHLFARLCFEALYPTKELDEGFHIDVICKALVDLLNAEGGGVVINLPPRNLKSFIASMVFPLFAIRRKPGLGIVVLAGSQDLATEFLSNVVKILDSERYRSIFGDIKYERTGSTLRFSNGGMLQFSVYMHNIIGRGFDLCIVDDPQSPAVAKNRGLREASNKFFDDSVTTRLNRSGNGKIVIVQQRLHPNDLSGYLIEQNKTWTSIRIPAVATNDEVWTTEVGQYIRLKGEVICPARETLEQLRERLRNIGGMEFRAQVQQAPHPDETQTEVRGRYYYFLPAGSPPGTRARPKFGRVKEADLVAQEVFGEDHGIWLYDPTPETPEDWERETIVQQAKLVASSQINSLRERPPTVSASTPEPAAGSDWKPDRKLKVTAKPPWAV